MNQIVEAFTEQEEFFAPAATDMIDGLIAQYRANRANIEQLAGLVSGDLGNAVHYFIEGNCSDSHRPHFVSGLFEAEGAIKALNSAYWSKALDLTDVLEYMPAKRREEWFESIRKRETPDFEEETVRSTIQSLLASRQAFFSEQVDGIFRALSRDHVTNVPQGFNKRMIIAGVINRWESTEYRQVGHIADLRKVIAKFMGRADPKWNATDHLVKTAYATSGKWIEADGGTIRIRVYKVGTAHLEIHPDIAYRLNQVLAFMHPMAIPSEFRTKPKKKHKEFQMMDRPLPWFVLEILAHMRQYHERLEPSYPEKYRKIENAFQFDYGMQNKAAAAEAEKVIAAIGGVKTAKGYFQFDYDAKPIMNEIACTGCIPDQKSHQFYPTPLSIAQAAIEMADISGIHKCLEPSAGIGGLADLMPKAMTYCVEISELHSEILRAKGYQVWTGDFMQFINGCYDRIVMNPPFSEGRAQAHVEHAAEQLHPNGRLVAILPASFKGKDVLPGFDIEWSRVYPNEFDGTSVSVVIMAATRRAD